MTPEKVIHVYFTLALGWLDAFYQKNWTPAFHSLRHTHASQLIDQNVDIVTISKRLGHAKPDITLRIYAHLFRKDDRKAADATSQFWTYSGGNPVAFSLFVLFAVLLSH